MNHMSYRFCATVRRECRIIASRRLYFLVLIIIPLFTTIFLSTVFGNGQIENLPVGIVDYTNSNLTRQIIMDVDASPVLNVEEKHIYTNEEEAHKAMQGLEIYGYLIIPPDFNKHLYNGDSPALVYCYQKSVLAAGEELNGAFLKVLSNIAAGFAGESGMAAGLTEAQVKAVAMPFEETAVPLYNPALNFSTYITYPFIFVFLQILMLVFTVYVIGSERIMQREHSFNKNSDCSSSVIKDSSVYGDWLHTAGGNPVIAIAGKLFPYFMIFCAHVLFANFICFIVKDIPTGNNLFALIIAGIMLTAATMMLGTLFIILIPNMSIAISMASMFGALGATTCGVTFPIEQMDLWVRVSAYIFPIRHFTHIYHNIAYHSLPLYFSLKDFIMIGLFIMPLFFISYNKICNLLYKESRFINLPNIYSVLLIAIGGTVGYSLLYNMLYLPNTVKEIPVAVVDESKTQLSRKYTSYLNATEGVNVYGNPADYITARKLLNTEKVRGIIYIPADFEKRIGQGKESVFQLYGTTTSLLYYLKIQSSAVGVMTQINDEYRQQIARRLPPAGQLALAKAPTVAVTGIPLYNQQGGYATFLIPVVFIVALFQTMLMAIGVYTGERKNTNVKNNERKEKISKKNNSKNNGNKGYSKLCHKNNWACTLVNTNLWQQPIILFTALYALLSIFVIGLVPIIFNLPALGNLLQIFPFILLFLLVTAIAGTLLSKFIPDSESITLIVPFFSVGLIFLSGMSFPREQMPIFWQALYYVFPCSPAITGYIKLNSMGAPLASAGPEIITLVLQGIIYGILLIYIKRLTR